MAEALGVAAAILQITGMGAKLSITIHKIGVNVSTAGSQLAGIARVISLFSLTLKQVGQTLQQHDSIHSPGAIETTKEIIEQANYVYSQVQAVVDQVQSFQYDGSLAPMNLAKKVKFCLKKTRIDCLLGELDSLKMTLSTMLQVLYTGRLMALLKKLEDAGIIPEQEIEAKEDEIEQEEDEIRTLVLTRHWALVRLGQLQSEAYQDESQTSQAMIEGLRTPPFEEREREKLIVDIITDQRMVVFTETSLTELDESLSSVSNQPQEFMLRSRDFVEYLLDKWTIIRKIEAGQDPRTGARDQDNSNDYASVMEETVRRKVEEIFDKAYLDANRSARPRKSTNYRRPEVEDDDPSDVELANDESESDVESIRREDQNHRTKHNINRKRTKKEGLGIRWWRGSDLTNTKRGFIDKSLKGFNTPDAIASRVSEASFGKDEWTDIPDFWVCEDALEAWDYEWSSYQRKTGKMTKVEGSEATEPVWETIHRVNEPLTFDEIEDLVELSAAIRDGRGDRSRSRGSLAQLVPRRTNTTDDMPYPNAPFGKLGHIAEGLLKEGRKWRPTDDNGLRGEFSRRNEGMVGSRSLLVHMLESKFGDKLAPEFFDIFRPSAKLQAVSAPEG